MEASLTATGVANALSLSAENVIGLRSPSLSPEHLDFVGLVRAGELHQLVPEAVVLHEGQPFIYIIDFQETRGISEQELQSGMRFLGLRADAPYVAVVRPGTVQVYALANIREGRPPVLEADELEPGVLARLIVGSIPARNNREIDCGAHELMLSLLNSVTDHLIKVRKIAPEEALALVGRALFMRFLGDRNIVQAENPIPGVREVTECFTTPEASAVTCAWLDATFNGDLLELPDNGSRAYFEAINSSENGSALHDLTAIMRQDKPLGDGVYQTQFSWGDLHFSYLPVGLLSQVYEEYAHRFDPDSAKVQSVYYTPRHLSEYMVDHAFKMLGKQAHKARILDPASGGGVFLLSAFRKLVKARWQATGIKPNTQVIRSILNNQLVGMDINPAARQLSALALYLTALELDSDASTLKNLLFTPLQGKVLIPAENWRDGDKQIKLGSLSSQAIEAYEGQFDLVIGNPPWTSVQNTERLKAMNLLVAEHMAKRQLPPSPNPDGVPDLPFLWASTRLAKPGAVLAFALHGRLLTKMSPSGHAARAQIFRGVEVKYVLNGMELRNTPVWPNMSAHFCLLLAHNKRSDDTSEFFAVTPVRDLSLNREGRVRIDSKDAWTSDVAMVERKPHLFKTLAKGNALDVELLERIEDLSYPSLGNYIAELKLPATHGYQTLQKNTLGVDSGFLRGMKVMPVAQEATWNVVPVNDLEYFTQERVHRLRSKENYEAPLVLLRQSPSSKANCPMAMLALSDVAYSRSYIGYSCKGALEPELLATYIAVIFNSSLYLYFVLMTSSFFGCERETQQKAEAELFPVRPLEKLTVDQRADLCEIQQNLTSGNSPSTEQVEAFIRKLYRLRIADMNLIRDRLALSLPFSPIKTNATKPAESKVVDGYRDALASALLPFDMSPTPTIVEVYAQSELSPWRFLRVGPEHNVHPLRAADMMAMIASADLLDASLAQLPQGDSLYVGILNQRRYWSRTSARTLAIDLIKRGHPVLSRGTTI
ncbi:MULTISPECIES: N-6 DNA methylase [unclassified Pseudomonas]|uniref:HsdM family class I SAM-dependent methyltransferase n=1 Tax=unclassified Pseudomonas TaxID=196821 RepID=UPI00128D462D|nr:MULTISPECIES: N-6 DNA methylase [unclassified Pseudomonas]MPQ70835.1 N-6 DNA methylase [Pseudomonas sp. MWU12-2323]